MIESADRRRTLDACIVLLLVGISLLVNRPVLSHPHWGLFNDIRASACQTFCSLSPPDMMRELISTFTHVDHGRYRPVYQLINPTLWSILPGNPFIFYFVRYCEFTATVVVSYFAALALSSSRLLSLATALIWFTATPTYEVLYTPDKTEVHVALLFALLIFIHLKAAGRFSKSPPTLVQTASLAIVVCLLNLCNCMIKETALLAAVFGALIVTTYVIANRVQKIKHVDGANVDVRWQFFSGGALMLSAIIFKLMDRLSISSTDHQYIAFNLSPSFTLQHLCTYAQMLPVYSSAIILSVAALFYAAYCSLRSKHALNFEVLACLQLIATSLAGCIVLAAWPATLMYIWFPIFALFLPAIAGIAKSTLRWNVTYTAAGALVVLIVFSLPQTIVNAKFQLSMDAGIDRMAARLASLPQTSNPDISIGLPYMTKQSAEIGFAVSEHTTRSLGQKQPRAHFFNFLWNVDANNQAPKSLEAVVHDLVVGNASYNPDPGLATFSLAPGTALSTEFNWQRAKLKPGDFLVIPYGNVPQSSVVYRGASIFSRPWSEALRAIPQVSVASPVVLDETTTGKLGGDYRLGWILLPVKNVVPVALDIETDGWLLNGAKITIKRRPSPQLLTLWFDMLAHDVTYTDGTTSHTAKPEKVTTRLSTIKIPISSSDKPTEVALQFSSTTPEKFAKDDRPVLLHLIKVSLDQS